MDGDIIRACADALPRYNDFLIRGFREQELLKAPETVGTIFSEAIRLFGGRIQYDKHWVLSPEERLEFEAKRGACIAPSELILVGFRFIFNSKYFYTYLYLPYIKDDFIVIKGNRMSLQLCIADRVFSKTADGITAKVVRAPLIFKRTQTFMMTSAVSDYAKAEFIIAALIWQKKTGRRGATIRPTIIHYLLCRFGFMNTMSQFGLGPTDCTFVSEVGRDVDTFEYFVAKKAIKKKRPDVFLKIRRSLLEDPTISQLVANVLYICTAFQKHSVADLLESSGTVYRIMLSRVLLTVANEAQGENQINTHIASVDLYLDTITRNRLADAGIIVSNIYDLLRHIFMDIGRIIVNSSHSNLYTKRIDVTDSVLVNTIGTAIYRRFYDIVRSQKKMDEKEVANILSFVPMLIDRLNKEKIVKNSPPSYGDNYLASSGIRKIRQSGSGTSTDQNDPQHRFHPSVAVAESLVAFSKQNPGIAGSINPYLPIDQDGSIRRPDYADAIDVLLDDLP